MMPRTDDDLLQAVHETSSYYQPSAANKRKARNAEREETRRLRVIRLGVERSQQKSPKADDAQAANKGRSKRLRAPGIVIGIVVMAIILTLVVFARM
jgi:hypothetical protein